MNTGRIWLKTHHVRRVDWLESEIPRSRFAQDLRYSLGAFMTICEVSRNNALERVKAALEGRDDPGLRIARATPQEAAEAVEDESTATVDIDELARDQILSHIAVHFTGHDLARLVEAVLRAQGYTTRLSPPGPDRGVDILAGRGLLGLDGPRLCVQVKSGSTSSDVNILRAMQGTMQNFQAEQGLLVSWNGYTREAEREARSRFFSVRLWDSSDLLNAVLENYEQLPEEIQSELPLKRTWTLVLGD